MKRNLISTFGTIVSALLLILISVSDVSAQSNWTSNPYFQSEDSSQVVAQSQPTNQSENSSQLIAAHQPTNVWIGPPVANYNETHWQANSGSHVSGATNAWPWSAGANTTQHFRVRSYAKLPQRSYVPAAPQNYAPVPPTNLNAHSSPARGAIACQANT